MPLKRSSPQQQGTSAPDYPSVLAGLGSPDAQARWTAARAAGSFPAAAGVVLSALRAEPDARVREALFSSLARMHSPEAIAALITLLRSDEASLRAGALDALRMDAAVVAECLPPLLSDADEDIRILSCDLARSLAGDAATGLLIPLLAREQDANVCAAAIDVLCELGTEEALPALADCGKRFAGSAFITFAVKVASDRIRAQSGRS